MPPGIHILLTLIGVSLVVGGIPLLFNLRGLGSRAADWQFRARMSQVQAFNWVFEVLHLPVRVKTRPGEFSWVAASIFGFGACVMGVICLIAGIHG